jgi:CRISPR/Cas system-associated exonuclease Cas4 (RecB family)
MDLTEQYIHQINFTETMDDILVITAKIEEIYHELKTRKQPTISGKDRLQVALALESQSC